MSLTMSGAWRKRSYETCDALAAKGAKTIRPAGSMANSSPDRGDVEIIAFIEDPDGYRTELIERADTR